MAHIPFAFSVSHFINSVGADAGFASIIGLAILVLLYFAQARETSTLRDRADEAEQRAGALEARLAQVSRAQSPQTEPAVTQRPAAAGALVNPAPAVQVAPAPAASVAIAAAALPSAPAGVGAPALQSATRLIPVPAPVPNDVAADLAEAEEASVPAVAAAAAAAAAAPVASAVAAPAAPTGAPPSAPQPDAPQPNQPHPPVGAPRPATAAGAAYAAASPSPSATAVFAGGEGPEGAEPGTNGHGGDDHSDEFPAVATQAPEPAHQAPPRVQLRPGGSGPVRPSQTSIYRSGSPSGSSRLHRGFAVLLAVLGIAAVAAVLLLVTSSGGGSPSSSSSSTATSNSPAAQPRTKAKAVAFVPGNVSVGVLNGTAAAGLAAKVMNQLASAGYKQGITPANAANQTQPTTVVAYLPGQRAAALHVASALKLSASAVRPIDSQTQQIACPQAGSCSVNVVVTVGQDLSGG